MTLEASAPAGAALCSRSAGVAASAPETGRDKSAVRQRATQKNRVTAGEDLKSCSLYCDQARH